MTKLINYKANFNQVNIGNNLTIYFSYETPIAFYDNGKLIISENIWSSTTGKHLNDINRDKSIRINNTEFNERFKMFLNSKGL